MSIARWVIVAGMLAVGACSTATGPAEDCVFSRAAQPGNDAPTGMVCTPTQPITSAAGGN
jgi:hypothetical protein